MTGFDDWWEKSEISSSGYVAAGCAWHAAQQAERDKYQELIAAAEAVVDNWYTPEWGKAKPPQETINTLREALVRMKNENQSPAIP